MFLSCSDVRISCSIVHLGPGMFLSCSCSFRTYTKKFLSCSCFFPCSVFLSLLIFLSTCSCSFHAHASMLNCSCSFPVHVPFLLMFLSCSCSSPAHVPFLFTFISCSCSCYTLMSRLSCSFQPNSGPTYSRITGTVVACCVCAADRLSTASSATSTAWSLSDISKHSLFHISTNAPDYWLVQTNEYIPKNMSKRTI